MKCHNCNHSDSLLRYMYVDKNNNLVTESELSAFEILHPEDKGKFYDKILLCGICYEHISVQQNSVFMKKVTPQTHAKKTPPIRKPQNNYYICPFCKTSNDSLRNTCEKCDRILFSTEYETKEVYARSFKANSSIFDRNMVLIPVIILAAIAFIATRGTGIEQTTVQSNQVIQSNFLSGQSSYEWPDGTKYTGEFKDGKPNGKGSLIWTTGQKYTGDFLNGQITGYGTMEYPGVGNYAGSFLNGKPNGQGTMSYLNGTVYTGNWVDGESE